MLRALVVELVAALVELNLGLGLEALETHGEHLPLPAEVLLFDVDVQGHAMGHSNKVESAILVSVSNPLIAVRDVCDAGSDHLDLKADAVSRHDAVDDATRGRICLLDVELGDGLVTH